jgi:hypothetical protein
MMYNFYATLNGSGSGSTIVMKEEIKNSNKNN